MTSKLKQITTEAKKLYKSGHYEKWTDAIKEASKKIGKKIGAVKKTSKKTVKKSVLPKKKKSVAKSYHKDTKSHNVRISVVSGFKFDNKVIEFLQKEGLNSKGYNYRGKILWGAPILLKETKNGTPVEKFYFDTLEIANEVAKELNKGQKYTKVKLKKI